MASATPGPTFQQYAHGPYVQLDRCLAGTEAAALSWRQPDGGRQEFVLLAGESVVATLCLDSRDRGHARSADGRWSFRPPGFWSAHVMAELTAPDGTVRSLGIWRKAVRLFVAQDLGTLDLADGRQCLWAGFGSERYSPSVATWSSPKWSHPNLDRLATFTLHPLYSGFGEEIRAEGRAALQVVAHWLRLRRAPARPGPDITVVLSQDGSQHPDLMLLLLLGRYLAESPNSGDGGGAD